MAGILDLLLAGTQGYGQGRQQLLARRNAAAINAATAAREDGYKTRQLDIDQTNAINTGIYQRGQVQNTADANNNTAKSQAQDYLFKIQDAAAKGNYGLANTLAGGFSSIAEKLDPNTTASYLRYIHSLLSEGNNALMGGGGGAPSDPTAYAPSPPPRITGPTFAAPQSPAGRIGLTIPQFGGAQPSSPLLDLMAGGQQPQSDPGPWNAPFQPSASVQSGIVKNTADAYQATATGDKAAAEALQVPANSHSTRLLNNAQAAQAAATAGNLLTTRPTIIPKANADIAQAMAAANAALMNATTAQQTAQQTIKLNWSKFSLDQQKFIMDDPQSGVILGRMNETDKSIVGLNQQKNNIGMGFTMSADGNKVPVPPGKEKTLLDATDAAIRELQGQRESARALLNDRLSARGGLGPQDPITGAGGVTLAPIARGAKVPRGAGPLWLPGLGSSAPIITGPSPGSPADQGRSGAGRTGKTKSGITYNIR